MTLRIGVIGPTGFGGSHLCIELLQRGHTVIGLSRHPEQLGVHEHYIPRSMDIDRIQIGELAKLLKEELRLDVLISEYGPHTSGHAALMYSVD
jgi:putative NADH-flavin reductase